MNPFLLMLLSFGGLMSFNAITGGGTTTTSSGATAANDDDDDTPTQAGNTTGSSSEDVAITMVLWDMVDKEIATEVDNGDTINLTADQATDYTFAAEVTGTSDVGSLTLTYQGQTWLQNVWPYTLEDSPIDLAEGDFEVDVTVYSGANATGDVLATETVTFSTVSVETVVEQEEEQEEDPVVEDDTPVVEDDDDPVVVGDDPTAPDQSGDGGSGAETDPIDLDNTVEVMTARSHTLEGPEDVVEVRIVSNLEHGNVTVNPDNSFAVVLTQTDFIGTQSFTYEATLANGSTITETIGIKSVEGVQDNGWGTGETHYMLATDEDDNIIIETGEVHQKVYISGSEDAYSRADIADAEGLNVSDITAEWLADSDYGRSEELALTTDVGMDLWNEINPRYSVSSNHLLFERGYEYDNNERFMARGISGEDELHPIYVGAYGEGDRPVLTESFIHNHADSSSNFVVQGIDFQKGVYIQAPGENVLLNDLNIENEPLVLMYLDSVTLRNSSVTDVHLEESRNGGDWDGSSDREQGMFGNFNNGLLIENTFFDLNGWALGYDPDGDGDDAQPPSIYSHNIYLGADMTDVTVRDTISMRAASIGLQLRSGGFVEDVALIDNEIGMNVLGGDYKGAGQVGEYSLLTDIVVTSGAHKTAEYNPARPMGIEDSGMLSTNIDNIITHLADPNNPDELDYKLYNNQSLKQPHDPYYDDTIIWNWQGANETAHVVEQNVDGLDTDALNQTTIQNFTAQLLGQDEATINDLGEYMRDLIDAGMMSELDADMIIQYFQEGFGIASDARTEAEVLRFIPNDLGDGVRWDNRLNWSTEDLPGTIDGDSVDLGGNHVVFGTNVTIDTLDLGDSGELNLYGGKLTVAGGIIGEDDGMVEIVGAGQLWTEGHSGEDLMIDIESGRFLNSGAVTNASVSSTGGETVLATGGAIFGVSDGETISLTDNSKIGFDDDDGGVALLAFEQGATVEYASEDGALGTIEEFRTGAFGDEPDVLSGIDLGDATLKIDLSGLSAANGEALMLMDADEIIGAFDDTDISGLGSRNATVTIDYVTDSVSLTLSSGSGNVLFETIGEADDVSSGEQALWDALTAGQGVFDDNAPDLPEDEAEYLEAS